MAVRRLACFVRSVRLSYERRSVVRANPKQRWRLTLSFCACSAELKEFWKAYDAAADTNAALGVGAASADKPAASEAADKAADALADSLGSVKVEDKTPAAA